MLINWPYVLIFVQVKIQGVMDLYLFQKNIWSIMVFFFHLISEIGAQAHHQQTTKGSGMDIGQKRRQI